jgi:hypothetical protein
MATLLTLTRMGARHWYLSEEITETDAELTVVVSTSFVNFKSAISVC